jgi:hypothetical protein
MVRVTGSIPVAPPRTFRILESLCPDRQRWALGRELIGTERLPIATARREACTADLREDRVPIFGAQRIAPY